MTRGKGQLFNTGPIAWMVNNPVASNLLMLILLIGGALMLMFKIKQEVFPDLASDTISIRVPYPGASPAEVEQGIILAVEESIRSMEGIKEITSTASEGSGLVRAELLLGADAMKVYQDIKSEIDRITTLPEDAERPSVTLDIRRLRVVDLTLFGDAPDTSLRELAERVRDRLLQDPKITQVDLRGARNLEITVEIPQENLRRYNLTIQEVAQRLSRASVEIPGGGIRAESGEILVRVSERRDFGYEFARIPIITKADGTEVLLEDIATVKDGLEEADRYAIFNGKPAIMLEVFRVGDQTPISVADATREQLKTLNQDLPAGMQIQILRDRSEIYRQRAHLLLKNGFMGLCLILLLLGSFLQLRLAFWVMMGVPISFLGTMFLMPATGLSINMVTMFAFIVALGIVVDDAIVVGENVYYYHQNGKSFRDAAIIGTREVSTPVAFSILTNVVAFIPLALLPGRMGTIMKMLPIVVISAFLFSWLECVFILPSHLAHHQEKTRRGLFGFIHNTQQRFSHWFITQVKTKFGPFLDFALSYRYVVVAFSIAIFITTISYVFIGKHMGFDMFPRVESDYAYGFATLPYGSPVERSEKVGKTMLAAARRVVEKSGHPELVKGMYADVGDAGTHTVEIRVYLADPEIREEIGIGTAEFVRRWREEVGSLPGTESVRMQADRGGPGGGSALTVELRHTEMSKLEEASADLGKMLEEFPRVTDIDDGFQPGKQQLDFHILPLGRSMGFTAVSVARQVRNFYYGTEVARQQRGRNEVKIKVRLPEEERVSRYDLNNMILISPNGKEVPLREVVTWEENRAYTTISRRDAQRTVSVTADVTPRSKTLEVTGELDNSVLPALMERYPGLSYSYQGRQAANRESVQSMITMVPLVFLAIYALLAIPFKSYMQPLIVMVSIPFGVVGAVIGHLIMGYSMSMIGVIGILALSGVVVNDSLILIDFANRERAHGRTPHDAILTAGVKRFRPILLTTLTTFGGLMPMIFETSRQARFLIPMALSLGYGILFATGITLLLIPSLYLVNEDFKRFVHWLRGKPLPQPAEPGEPDVEPFAAE